MEEEASLGTCEWKWDEDTFCKEEKERKTARVRTQEPLKNQLKRWQVQRKRKEKQWKKKKKKKKKKYRRRGWWKKFSKGSQVPFRRGGKRKRKEGQRERQTSQSGTSLREIWKMALSPCASGAELALCQRCSRRIEEKGRR